MIIQSGNIGMNTKRSCLSYGAAYSSLATWGAGKRSRTAQADKSYVRNESSSDASGQESGFNDSMNHVLDRFHESQSISATRLDHLADSMKRIHRQIYEHLMYWLFGGKMPEADLSSSVNEGTNLAMQAEGGSYTRESFYSETETTSFSTMGTVVTADGRTIDFKMSVSMSRSFTQYASTHLNFGAPLMTDPLVINLDDNIASVSDQKFYFDLDADGHDEYISILNAGSGYLALDKNKDGVINNGSELFGTTSGDGFADLAQYDEDHNGWIDENDSIFDSLMIWQRNEDGTDRLCGIGMAGVGAIYLGSADTPFSLKSGTDNHTNAQIQKTGLFLYENGNVGTIQHLNLAR